ncbi:hypothetical protein D3C87_1907640 [compost metagenome]
MPVERDFVACLGLVVVDPGVGGVWLHLALEIGLDVLGEGHVLGVAQRAVRLRLALLLAFQADHRPPLVVQQGAFDRDGAIAEGGVVQDQ